MIDLHMHSTYSDGSLTPAELLQMAENAGLELISITDHNRIGAYEDLKDPGIRSKFSGKIITGCEFSISVRGQLAEILGFGFDPCLMEPFIRQHYNKDIHDELHLIYSVYKERGVRLDLPESAFSREKYISAKRFVLAQLRSHPENHKFFMDPSNQKVTLRYYRQELYNPKSPLYVDYSVLHPSPKAVVDQIHEAGGKAFLAHCFEYTSEITDCLLEIVAETGLDGLECYYSKFTPSQTEYLVNFCKENHLLISGGSDFHGALRPEVSLGSVAVDPQNFAWCEKTI